MYVCVGGGSGWEGIVCVCGEWEDKVNFSHMI